MLHLGEVCGVDSVGFGDHVYVRKGQSGAG